MTRPPRSRTPKLLAHIQRRGDILAKLGEWVGERSSKQWIEGFALAPRASGIAQEDIRVSGGARPWLAFTMVGRDRSIAEAAAWPCQSSGLRVRFRGEAEKTHTIKVSGTFTDGTEIGPVGPGGSLRGREFGTAWRRFSSRSRRLFGAETAKPALSPATSPSRAKAQRQRLSPFPPRRGAVLSKNSGRSRIR